MGRTSSDWNLATDQVNGGQFSAKADRYNDEDFICDPLDTSSAISIRVQFYYRLDDTEDNDFVLYFDDGVGDPWDQIAQLGGGTEDTWLYYDQTFTDIQYFHANFRIRLDADSLDSGYYSENVWIDDVTITMTYMP